MNAKDKAVRFRVCQLLALILNQLNDDCAMRSALDSFVLHSVCDCCLTVSDPCFLAFLFAFLPVAAFLVAVVASFRLFPSFSDFSLFDVCLLFSQR